MTDLSSDTKFLLRYLLVVLLSMILLYFIPRNAYAPKPLSGSLAGVDPAWADTTLKYMNTDEKLQQLIICETHITDQNKVVALNDFLKDFKAGGLLLIADSIRHRIDLQTQSDTFNAIPLLQIMRETDLTKMLNTSCEFPGYRHAASLRDDSLRIDYYRLLAKTARLMNINGLIPADFPQEEKDSALQADLLKLRLQFAEGMIQENFPAILPENQMFSQDSLHFNFNTRLFSAYTGIIKNEGAQEAEAGYSFQHQRYEKYGFGGALFVQAPDDSLDLLYQHFISDAHAFITAEPEKTFTSLKYLLKENRISEQQIDQKVRMLLLLKTYAGIDSLTYSPKDSLDKLLTNKKTKILLRRIFKNACILTKKAEKAMPFTQVKNGKYLLINTTEQDLDVFTESFEYYLKPAIISSPKADKAFADKLSRYSRHYKTIVLASERTDTAVLRIIFEKLPAEQLSVIQFGTTIDHFQPDSAANILQIWGTGSLDQKYAAEALWGGIPITAILPPIPQLRNRYSEHFSSSKTRVAQALPEETGLSSEILKRIDTIAEEGIYRGAYPGCQVVVLKNGYEVFNKAYGWHDYTRRQRVKNSDIYDLASVTKIAAATTGFMRMYDQGKMRLNDPLGKYFKDTKIDYSNIKPDTIINIDTLIIAEIKDFKKLLKYQDTLHINDSMLIAYDTLLVRTTPSNNIFKVKLRDLLLHKSGITPTLPILPYLLYKKYFYDSLEYKKQVYAQNAIASGLSLDSLPKYNSRDSLKAIFDRFFSRKYIKDSADIRIAAGFYFKRNYFDTLWKHTKRLRVYSRKIYQYADINMILLQQAMDTVNKRDLDSYLKREIYHPMGLNNMSFKPYKYFDKSRIIPTENDKYWREQVLRGDVHDPSAAILGGISGNAGLFSNAYDLAVLGQMWLNRGKYGGRRYIAASTVNLFIGPQEDSHRGLGFDKASPRGINAPEAPSETFGHTGFTGTCIWVDPVNEIVFVFLSNRVHPNQKNWRISTYRIRQNIHSVIYQAMIQKGETQKSAV